MSELEKEEINSWEIGYVREGKRTAVLEKIELIEV